MVCVDGSDNGDIAFRTAISLLKGGDTLYVISVAQQVLYDGGGLNGVVEKEHRKILSAYGKRCKDRGIEYHPILGKGFHSGSVIVEGVDQKLVDTIVIGRRGMNRFSRLLAGSTSKYVVEHAKCNVLVVKGNFLAEEHDSLTLVDRAERKERRDRVLARQDEEVHDSKSKVVQLEEDERERRLNLISTPETPPAVRAMKSDLDKHIAVMAEEEERVRRMKAGDPSREVAHVDAVVDEELEGERRMVEEAVVDDRIHHVEVLQLEE